VRNNFGLPSSSVGFVSSVFFWNFISFANFNISISASDVLYSGVAALIFGCSKVFLNYNSARQVLASYVMGLIICVAIYVIVSKI
jgi:hypothetical protein